MTWNSLHFSLCPFPPVLLLGTTESISAFFACPHQVCIHTDMIPLSSLFFRLNIPGSLSLSSWQVPQFIHHFCGPPLDSCQYAPVSLVLGSSDLDTPTHHSRCALTRPENKGRITSLNLHKTSEFHVWNLQPQY